VVKNTKEAVSGLQLGIQKTGSMVCFQSRVQNKKSHFSENAHFSKNAAE
jgi:hypothetical protein